MKKITVNLSFFNQHKVLVDQVESWKSWRKEIRDQFSFCIIDDCSKKSALDILTEVDLSELDISIYRVLEDLYCNIAGVRNLSAKECKTDWMIIIDMDTFISEDLAESLLDLAIDERGKAYKFNRRVPNFKNHIKEGKMHPAVTLLRNDDYWEVGGCEEDLVGHYGSTDFCFWHRAKNVIEVIDRKDLYLDYVPEGESDIVRETVHNHILAQTKARNNEWSNTYVRFPWKKQYPIIKYNIFTVANEAYVPFLEIFVNSVLDKCPEVNHIIIGDVGLGEYRKHFSKKDKVILLDCECDNDFTGIHSDGWAKATRQKTLSLLKLMKCMDFDIPLIMIDNDVCVLKDLSPLIDNRYDIQITSRPPVTNPAGFVLKEIASFMIFNRYSNSKRFIETWISKMKELEENNEQLPHETPALNLVVEENSNHLSIGNLEEKISCAPRVVTDDSYAAHFKSVMTQKCDKVTNFEMRITNIINNSRYDIEIDKYLDEKFYEDWKQ